MGSCVCCSTCDEENRKTVETNEIKDLNRGHADNVQSRETFAHTEDNQFLRMSLDERIEKLAEMNSLKYDLDSEDSDEEIPELALLKNPTEAHFGFEFSKTFIQKFIESKLENNDPMKDKNWTIFDKTDEVQTLVNLNSPKITEFKVIMRFPKTYDLQKVAKAIFVPGIRAMWDTQYLQKSEFIPLRNDISCIGKMHNINKRILTV